MADVVGGRAAARARAAGYRAIDSLRLEKGYRVWGADITPDDSPFEGGLGFAVKSDKEFLGKAALVEEPARRLCCLVLEDPRSVALANEPVRVGDAVVGRVTSGGYGYSVARSIAYAYLPSEHAAPGTEVSVEIFGEWVEGEVARTRSGIPKGSGSHVTCCYMSTADTKALIEEGVARFQREVPALQQLKLVLELELRGRGDIQLFRVEVPGPKITKDIASDAKVRLSVPRSHFNELAREGTIRHWREGFESGTVRPPGRPRSCA